MQGKPFVSSTGESRNPIYEGQFDGETPQQAETRRHWAKVAMELARDVDGASNQSEQALSADAMADRFISWPLPDSVRPDPCAMNPEYPHRYGTNLLTWAQAKAMFEYVLAAEPCCAQNSSDHSEDARYMVPSVDQLAEALNGVQCFHDLSAELIAPTLRANLIVAIGEPASDVVPVPRENLADFIEYSVHGPYGCDAQWLANKSKLCALLNGGRS